MKHIIVLLAMALAGSGCASRYNSLYYEGDGKGMLYETRVQMQGTLRALDEFAVYFPESNPFSLSFERGGGAGHLGTAWCQYNSDGSHKSSQIKVWTENFPDPLTIDDIGSVVLHEVIHVNAGCDNSDHQESGVMYPTGPNLPVLDCPAYNLLLSFGNEPLPDAPKPCDEATVNPPTSRNGRPL